VTLDARNGELLAKQDFTNRNESNEIKDARETNNFDRGTEFDLSTFEMDCAAILVRFTARIHDANESNEKLFRRRCK